MILGIGSDIIDIRRIEAAMQRRGDRFTEKLFTPAERETAAARPHPAASYAKYFAAKEACAKALGTGMSDGIFFSYIEVGHLPSGAPTLGLSGPALQRLKSLTPEGAEAALHLSLSDDKPFAQAFVVIEARPNQKT